jgi:hypothetical protein
MEKQVRFFADPTQQRVVLIFAAHFEGVVGVDQSSK